MNFETGVISASSPSIGGACAAAGPHQPAASSATSTRIVNRVIARLLSRDLPRRVAARFYDGNVSGNHPPLGPLHRPPPVIVSRCPRRLVPSGLEPPLERPAPLDLAERAPHARAEPRQIRGAERRRLD